MSEANAAPHRTTVSLAILVAALGYFVDVYDLLLFSILRVPSLSGLGVPEPDILAVGVRLINMQMTGLLLGGIFWGILGDKFGRRSVLFGSILVYSLANIANGMVQTVDQYAWLRLAAGLGLAGELGAGITLVAEAMSKEGRGWGTTLVASLGLLGAVVAGIVGDLFPWRIAFFVGGGLGLVLLALRFGVRESSMFTSARKSAASRGNLLTIFRSPRRTIRYAAVVLVGLPTWYVMSILVTFSPELGQALGLSIAPSAAKAVMYAYVGATIGDLVSGSLSQLLRSRKKTIFIFLLTASAAVTTYFLIGGRSPQALYWACFLLGSCSGYWAVFVTVAAEQFGTNLRATVASTAPNFVRGAVVPITLLFQSWKTTMGVERSAIAVGVITIVIAFISLAGIDETYGKNLDYVDT